MTQPTIHLPADSHTFTVNRGSSTIACKIRGHGSPVIMIQGVGVHGDGWLPQVENLRTDFQCITIDNRGIGASSPPREPLSVPQMTDDILAVMDTLEIKSAHIVGHSLGGLVAQHLALLARHRVRSLALLCTVANGQDATRLTFKMLRLGIASRIGPKRWRRRAFLQIVMPPSALRLENPDALAQRLAPLFGYDLATLPNVVHLQLAALKAYDSTPRLHELAGIPTLVLSAQHDLIAPPSLGRSLAAAIPESQFHEIPDAAHGVIIQRAPEINQLLRNFWSTVDNPNAQYNPS